MFVTLHENNPVFLPQPISNEESFEWTDGEQNLYTLWTHNETHYTPLTYTGLVWWLKFFLPEGVAESRVVFEAKRQRLHENSDQAETPYSPKNDVEWNYILYQRVYQWCDDNDVVRRTINRSHLAAANEKAVAQRILGTRNKVKELRDEHKLPVESLFNLDETPLRPFNLAMKTLHYLGDKNVPLDARLRQFKFCLSLAICWFGSGAVSIQHFKRG